MVIIRGKLSSRIVLQSSGEQGGKALPRVSLNPLEVEQASAKETQGVCGYRERWSTGLPGLYRWPECTDCRNECERAFPVLAGEAENAHPTAPCKRQMCSFLYVMSIPQSVFSASCRSKNRGAMHPAHKVWSWVFFLNYTDGVNRGDMIMVFWTMKIGLLSFNNPSSSGCNGQQTHQTGVFFSELSIFLKHDLIAALQIKICYRP